METTPSGVIFSHFELAVASLERGLDLVDQPFAEKRSADLEHELDIVLIAELERAPEASERLCLLSEFEKGFPETGECVFVLGIED